MRFYGPRCYINLKCSVMNTALEYSRRIYVSTNFSCNLNCVYCFEKNKNDIEFNVDEAVSILEKC